MSGWILNGTHQIQFGLDDYVW